MKLNDPRCPECGEPAIGTLDIIQGVALFDGDPAESIVEYGGATKVDWNTQKSQYDDAGRVLVTCFNADTWWSAIH